MVSPPVYIAGVGISYLQQSTSEAAINDVAISAGTKALLDAGLTYNEVKHSVACFLGSDLRISKASFASYGKTGTPVSEVDCYSALFATSQCIKSGHPDCAMMIGFDKEAQEGKSERVAIVAVILVSEKFLITRAYLKDSAAMIRGFSLVSPIHIQSSNSDSETLGTKRAIQGALEQAVLAPEDIQIVELRHGSNPSAQQALGELRIAEDEGGSPVSHPFVGSTGLAGLCELVWQLRGWTKDRSVPGAKNCLQYTMGPDGTAYVTIISRARLTPTPKWEEIEHLRDGRERLGYNPALESKDITIEDWRAVKARDEFIPDKTGERLRLTAKGGDRAALARL